MNGPVKFAGVNEYMNESPEDRGLKAYESNTMGNTVWETQWWSGSHCCLTEKWRI